MAGKRVLVVDDDPKLLRKVSEILREAGFEVHATKHPGGAVRLAAKVHPALAILDVDMPGMNGFELAEKIHTNAKTARIPCMFLTGQQISTRLSEATEVRAVAYLEKPFRKESLLTLVRQALSINGVGVNPAGK